MNNQFYNAFIRDTQNQWSMMDIVFFSFFSSLFPFILIFDSSLIATYIYVCG